MDDWEKLAEEPAAPAPKVVPVVANINKWDGEDEDDVKDSWEDEDEEENKDEKKEDEDGQVVKKAKPQKSLSKKIAERERLKQEQEEAKALEREANMTPEEKLAEKLRLQKIQEEADLRAAMDTFGITEAIDTLHPKNKSELSELSDAIGKKVSQYKHLVDFPGFLEELVRNVCANLCSTDLQKIKKTIDNLYAEKQKLEKEKNKKSNKGKTKVNLRIETDSENLKEYGNYESYDYDDFM